MKPEDKDRLKDAFAKALANDPRADAPIEGHFNRDGTPLTRRQFVERELKSEKFYQRLDTKIASGRTTLDRFIRTIDKLADHPEF